MYELAPLRRKATSRVANVRGLLQSYYMGVQRLLVLKAAWDRVEAGPGMFSDVDAALHSYIEGIYEPDEIADMWLAVDEAAATVADWATDHAALLAA